MADVRVKELIKKYLTEGKVMQLATVSNGKPWVCTVYYVFYSGNLYWLSWPERRHSRELAHNSQVAATVAVKLDVPVIGVQVEGLAVEVKNEDEIKTVMALYTEKYNAGHSFYDAFTQGKNHHYMYKLTPEKVQLFDELHFPKNDIKQVEQL